MEASVDNEVHGGILAVVDDVEEEPEEHHHHHHYRVLTDLFVDRRLLDLLVYNPRHDVECLTCKERVCTPSI